MIERLIASASISQRLAVFGDTGCGPARPYAHSVMITPPTAVSGGTLNAGPSLGAAPLAPAAALGCAPASSGFAFGLLPSAAAESCFWSCRVRLVPSAWLKTARSSSRVNHRASG